MTNIQVDIAQRSQRHCDGRSKLDARIYRSSFKSRKAQISEIALACESKDAYEANGSKVADLKSVYINPLSEQQRPDIGTEHDSCLHQGELDQIQHVPSPHEVLSSSRQMDDSSSMKEEGADIDMNNGVTVIEQSTSSLQDSLNPGDTMLKFKEYWVPVHLSDFQLEQYCSILAANCKLLCSSSSSDRLDLLQDTLNALKKCCDHPYVLDLSLQASAYGITNDALSAGIEVSGKIQLLSKFLPEIKQQKLKVLILYKTMGAEKNSLKLGDILDDFVCQTFGRNAYIHIYGGAYLASKKLQTDLDLFNVKDIEKFVVLVEHSRSFRGVKLSSVDIVILFNSSWNPGYDLRALQRMTLETKSDHLMVFRLYSVSTLEEKSLVLAKKGIPISSNMNRSISHQLLMWGATQLFNKLDELHGLDVSKLTLCPKTELLQSLLLELCIIMSSSSKDDSVSLVSHITKGGDGHYENIWLYGEPNFQSVDDELPHAFWLRLLENKSPQWRFLPKTSDTRKRRILSSTFVNVPRRKRSCVLNRSEKSSGPKQRQGEWENGGALVNLENLTGSSQCYCVVDLMPSSSSKNGLTNSEFASNSPSSTEVAGNIEEPCNRRKIGKTDRSAVIQENSTVKAKPKCMTVREDAQVITTEDIHHGQISLSFIPITLKEPDSLPVYGPIMASELYLGSKKNDRNCGLSGATPRSEPMKSVIHSLELLPEKETGSLLSDVATVSLLKNSSTERDIISLDSDGEQICEPKNPVNSANLDSCNEQLNEISAAKPSYNLLKRKTDYINVDSDDEQKEAELAPDLLKLEVADSSTKLSDHLCNGQTKEPEDYSQLLTHTTEATTVPLNSGDEQISPTSQTNLDATGKIMPSSVMESMVDCADISSLGTSIVQIHQASSVQPSVCHISSIPLGLNPSQNEDNSNAEISSKNKKQDMVNAPLGLPASTLNKFCTRVDPEICVSKDWTFPLEQVGNINLPGADVGYFGMSSSKPKSRGSEVDSPKQQPNEDVGPSLQVRSRSSDPPLSMANIQPICGWRGSRNTGSDFDSSLTCQAISDSSLQLGSCLRTEDRPDPGRYLLLVDAEKIRSERLEIEKKYEGWVVHIKDAYEKESAELRRNYETSLQKANVELLQKQTELREYYEKACANQLLAEALRLANNMEILETSEVAQAENSCTSTNRQMPQLSFPLPAQATHSPPVISAGGALLWSSNELAEPILPHIADLTRNSNMDLYGKHVYGSLVPGTHVHSLGQSDIRLRPVILGGQAVNSFTRGSLTSPQSHQPNVVGGIGQYPAYNLI